MRKYSDILSNIKRQITPICGENIAFSYPVPDIVNGIKVEKFFIYPISAKLERTRPYVMVTTLMEDGCLCKFQNCRFEDFVNTEEHPFSQKIEYKFPMERYESMKEIKLEQNLLNKTYELIRQLAFQDSLNDVQKSILVRYFGLFEHATPDYLAPYYKAMGKNFIEWMVKNV